MDIYHKNDLSRPPGLVWVDKIIKTIPFFYLMSWLIRLASSRCGVSGVFVRASLYCYLFNHFNITSLVTDILRRGDYNRFPHHFKFYGPGRLQQIQQHGYVGVLRHFRKKLFFHRLFINHFHIIPA